MQRISQPESLFIELVEQDQWTPPKRWSDCYELIMIQAGEGHYIVNGHHVAYYPGDVFFVSAQDQYSFSIAQRTSLYLLSVSSFYVANLPARESHSWVYLHAASSLCLGSIAPDVADQDKLRALISILLAEKQNFISLTDNLIVESLMTVILSLVSRLLAQHSPVTMPARQAHFADITRRVIAYITQHISEPHQLRLDVMADVFHYSPSHFSALFKQQAGDSIQQFIIRHKLKLVAMRLRQSTLTVSQVADEFGFTDVCHLNKLFKRHYKRTPTTYRQSLSI